MTNVHENWESVVWRRLFASVATLVKSVAALLLQLPFFCGVFVCWLAGARHRKTGGNYERLIAGPTRVDDVSTIYTTAITKLKFYSTKKHFAQFYLFNFFLTLASCPRLYFISVMIRMKVKLIYCLDLVYNCQ